jgi:uncharacterized protein
MRNMNSQGDTEAATLRDIVEIVRSHPGLTGKAGLKLVSEVLGASDWVQGPGDDTAAVPQAPSSQDTFVLAAGEAIYPPLLRADPCSAGMAAVIANVNDVAAMGGRPLGIVDTIVAPEATARLILEGMNTAARMYHVPILGGHLTILDDADPSLSAFIVGHAQHLLSATSVARGQALLLACCLDGTMRADFPFFSSSRERGDRLAHDIETLAVLADTGRCLAAKDVSMAGLLGSLAMLLEPTGCGATVVLDKVPRPAGVPLNRWVQAFPQFSFLLCAPPAAVPACRQAFAERGLTCEEIGGIDGSGELKLQLGSRRHMLLDLSAGPVTGLRREPATAPGNQPTGPSHG